MHDLFRLIAARPTEYTHYELMLDLISDETIRGLFPFELT
jgi:hypothetical protein